MREPSRGVEPRDEKRTNAGPIREAERGEKTSVKRFQSSDTRIHTDASQRNTQTGE